MCSFCLYSVFRGNCWREWTFCTLIASYIATWSRKIYLSPLRAIWKLPILVWPKSTISIWSLRQWWWHCGIVHRKFYWHKPTTAPLISGVQVVLLRKCSHAKLFFPAILKLINWIVSLSKNILNNVAFME